MSDLSDPGPNGSSKRDVPLIRVLSQIHWREMSTFDLAAAADGIAGGIGADYPLRDRISEAQIVVTPQGPASRSGGTLHRFVSGDEKWVVTLASTSISLETSVYPGHEDFIERLVAVVGELQRHLPFQQWQRFGYRYTNQLSDEGDMADITDLFDPSVLGAAGLKNRQGLVHTVTETMYQSLDASLLVKSAYLPANAIVDPQIPPVPRATWLLDLDAFAMGPSAEFNSESVAARAEALSERAHRFFLEVTTDEYRRRFNI